MSTEADPILGQWYQHLDKGQKFKVVAFDESGDSIEIQHFDGDIEEVGKDVWYTFDVEPIEMLEDWTGPMDDIEYDDLDYTETEMSREDWAKPLKEVARNEEEWERADEQDEWGEGLSEEEPIEDEDQ